MSRVIDLFYVFFQGIVIFQALIFAVIYMLTLKKDVLFYSLFLCSIAAYFFINAPYTFFGIPEEDVWHSRWYGYLNTPVIIVANILYFLFHQAFFADLTNNRLVKKMFRFVLILMPLLLLLFTFLNSSNFSSQVIYYIAKIVTVLPAGIVAYIIIKEKLPFYKWIAAGLICVVVGTSLTAWMDYLYSENIGTSIFSTTYPFFFVKLGLLGEIIFYLVARIKKWNYQEKQLAVEKLQSQLAIEKLRNRISGELHDDIGSTLSGIAMYGHMAGVSIRNEQYEKANASVEIMRHSANEAVHKLGDLVWSINPNKDSFKDLIEKAKNYGYGICAAKNISFEHSVDEISLTTEITMDTRQHLYLLIKEAINNAVKYSGAGKINFTVSTVNDGLEIMVKDNGAGFDAGTITEGNGMTNIKSRAAAINGKLEITSHPGNGTIIKLFVKL